MKKEKQNKLREFTYKFVKLALLFLALYFGIQILQVFFTIPILAMYSAAYDMYQITGDASSFEIAAAFVDAWIFKWVGLGLSLIFLATIKFLDDKRKKKNGYKRY